MADYADAQNDATASADNIDDAIVSTESEIKDLTDAYQEAYTAAQQSVESQYELWDKAAESEKTSMVNKHTEYVKDFSFTREPDGLRCTFLVKGRNWEEQQLGVTISA